MEELRSLFGQAIGLAPADGGSVEGVARSLLRPLRPGESAAEVVERCCRDWDADQFGALLGALGEQGGDDRCGPRRSHTARTSKPSVLTIIWV